MMSVKTYISLGKTSGIESTELLRKFKKTEVSYRKCS